MSVLTKQEKTVHVGLEKFSGRQIEFATWKDKLLTHMAQLDLYIENRLLETGQPEPKVGMRDFLESTPPRLTDVDVKAAPRDEQLGLRREIMVWRKADAALRHVLNSTLPNSFLSSLPDDVRNLEVCVIWQHLEHKFTLGDAGGLVSLTNRWNRILNSNWKDTMTLFSLLNQARNEKNRKSKKLLGKEMMTETMMCVQVLAQLPSETWASSIELSEEAFSAERVEIALNKLFGDRSKKMFNGSGDVISVTRINNVKSDRAARGYDSKKRKSDGSTNVQDQGCIYCFKKGHQKVQCERMKADRDPNGEGVPLFRTNMDAQQSKRASSYPNNIATVQRVAKKNSAFRLRRKLIRKMATEAV